MLGSAFIFEARLFAWRNQLMKFTAYFSIATLATFSLGALLFAQGVDIKEIMAKANKAGADAAIGKLATSCTGCHKAHKN